jgi:hypothetical protein
MKTRTFITIIASLAGLSILIGAFLLLGIGTQASTLPPNVTTIQEGYCYIEPPTREQIVYKTTFPNCFGQGGGDFWCDDIVFGRCYFSPDFFPAELTAHEIPVAPTGEPSGQVEPPVLTDQPEERPSGYLNDPFGAWQEPGYCLAEGSRQFDIFQYEDAIDCIEKVPEGQACDYQNECFADQRSLVDYLQQFTP